MATGQAPDPRKRKTSAPHATYLSVKPGQKEPGYKAGEMHGVYGHRTHAHQPCVFEITQGQMKCPYCAGGNDPVWRGYVPVYDRDWALRYVLVNEEYHVTTDVIPFREQVLLLKSKDPKSPLVIREEKVLTRELPAREPWTRPVNMLAICLTLWKNDPLTNWYRRNRPAELELPTLPDPPKGAKYAKDPLVKLAEAEARAQMEAAEEVKRIGTVIDAVMRPAPTANGVYKKPR